MMVNLSQVPEAAKNFTRLHLRECSAELLNWQAKDVRCDGRVLELANLLKGSACLRDSDDLEVAASLINLVALEVAAAPAPELPVREGFILAPLVPNEAQMRANGYDDYERFSQSQVARDYRNMLAVLRIESASSVPEAARRAVLAGATGTRSRIPAAATSGVVPTVTLNGYQLREALALINPDGVSDPLQCEDELTFGFVQYRGDDVGPTTGMCCWNGDTDGVYPLDGDLPLAAEQVDAMHCARVAAYGEALRAAAGACMRATPDRSRLRAIGEAAHYSACAEAVLALAMPASLPSAGVESMQQPVAQGLGQYIIDFQKAERAGFEAMAKRTGEGFTQSSFRMYSRGYRDAFRVTAGAFAVGMVVDSTIGASVCLLQDMDAMPSLKVPG